MPIVHGRRHLVLENDMNSIKIGLSCEGNIDTAFSGTAKRMRECLEAKSHHVVPMDASLSRLRRRIAAISTISLDKGRWRSKFRYGATAGKQRAASAVRSLRGKNVDIVLQIGASYDPPMDIPYAIYSDWNVALDEVEAREKGASRGLTPQELSAIGRDHARRYRGASAIFTISEKLRQSFIEHYGIDPDRVHTAYAGPNFDASLIEDALAKPKTSTTPTVLFIGKEFHRKGGDTVAAAMKQLPAVRLVFAGSTLLPKDFAGMSNVEHLGMLDKNDPEQMQRLLQAYRDSDVFILPTRHDPFPTVIREAMFFGMPCIASDVWAMREMIVDGETGYLIPPNDPKALSERLAQLLGDAQLLHKFGCAARLRAEKMFRWEAVGDVLHTGIQRALAI